MTTPQIELRLPRMESPRYTPGYYGTQLLEWRTGEQEDAEVGEWGYATGQQWEPNYVQMRDTGRVTRRANRLEREVGGVHLVNAKGTVVVFGVGMGLFVYNAVQKPEVQRVLVVDPDASLLGLVRQNARDNGWPNMHKVGYLRGDPRAVKRDHLHAINDTFLMKEVDYLYVDDWPRWRDVGAFREIVNNVNPVAAGFAGQELSFMDWAVNVRRPAVEPYDQVNLTNFDEWCLWTEAYMHTRSLDYLRYCLITWLNQAAFEQVKARSNG